MYTPTEEDWNQAEATLKAHFAGRTLHLLERMPELMPCSFEFHLGPGLGERAIVWGEHVIHGYGSVAPEVFADYAKHVDLSQFRAHEVAGLAMSCSIQPSTALVDRWQYFETREPHGPRWAEVDGKPAVAIRYLSHVVAPQELAALQAQLAPGESREFEVESPAEDHLLIVDGEMLVWYPMTTEHKWKRQVDGPPLSQSRSNKQLAFGLLAIAGIALAIWQLAF
ncbi:MAG: hypothetical protein KJO07_01680 [Deltaproteobacteria bacterium]|nr:hypothetical protein [Deltaproteobacteria bacterium]